MGKWTKGPVERRGRTVYAMGHVDTWSGPVWGAIATAKPLANEDADGRRWVCDGVEEDNAALVAEAFNTAHETNLTPRQLSDQRAELLGQALEALEAARIELENEGAWVPTKVTAVLALAKGEK